MGESTYTCIINKPMDITDFYTIETPPPSSSTSKDSIDESLLLIQSKNKLKSSTTTTHSGLQSNHAIICSTSKSTLKTNANTIKDDEVIFLTIFNKNILINRIHL